MLFTLGKFGIGLYLGRSSVGSAYGAAGSLVLLLVWVYYSAQILFFGAELTQVYARRHGSRLGLAEEQPAAAEKEGPSPKDAGRVVPGKRDAGTTRPAPVPASSEPRADKGRRPAAAPAAARIDPAAIRPPASAVGRGLAFSVVLLLLGFITKKRWS